MANFRGGITDDRRRRLFTDANKNEESSKERTESSNTSKRSRTKSTELDPAQSSLLKELPKSVDLVPQRGLYQTLILFSGLAITAGLLFLHTWMEQFTSLTADGTIASFNLDEEGSIATWYSSFLMTMAAMTCLAVYAVRREMVSDYRARYRIWLWAATVWLVMSIDETGSLHEGFKELAVYLSGNRLYGDGALWWVIPYSVILGTLGIALWFDMRGSRLARTTFLTAGTCYVVAVLTKFDIIKMETATQAIMLEEGIEMVGNLFVLLTMTLHVRYVVLVASGVIPSAEEKKLLKQLAKEEAAAQKAKETKKVTSKKTKTESKQVTKKKDVVKPEVQSEEETESEAEIDFRNMSKRQRKKLLRQQEAEQKKAEAAEEDTETDEQEDKHSLIGRFFGSKRSQPEATEEAETEEKEIKGEDGTNYRVDSEERVGESRNKRRNKRNRKKNKQRR